MGNQVTTLGQIYPIEYLLADYCNDLTLDSHLGSTRFMKVAKVWHKNVGHCVAKVYAITDPSLNIQVQKSKIELIRQKLLQDGNLNALPFIDCLINDKSIILLRQYVKYNLYDRLSTRPFLTAIEKRWIAYQILRTLQSIHRQSIYHGDIKSENILVTSFLWVTLSDFASYKPVSLPENNPSDFSYFFDTSRRHSCNMAPERFVEPNITPIDSPSEKNNFDTRQPHELNESNQLTSQMDLFSAGCVLAEIFAEDTANGSLFDLGQILMYKKLQYDPTKMIEESIIDPRIQRLVSNLTDLDPNKRNSATYHLEQLQPALFPSYFETLYKYIEKLILLTPDARIFTLSRDLDKILEEIITEDEAGLLLPLILVTSNLRSLKNTEAKLSALKLCVKIVESSPACMSEFKVDRLLPYIIQMFHKTESRVRAICVSSLSNILSNVDHLPSTDSNVFVDYILPALQPLAFDSSVLVRIALATNIAELAQVSRRFLDKTDKNFDLKLNQLQDEFGAIVRELLTDSNNCVRRATVASASVSKLCDFFGKQKTNEIILGHTITFLNDKNDFRLRASFFQSIYHTANHLGQTYAQVLEPLMQQGLADTEEVINYQCLRAIAAMTEKDLLTKEVVYGLFLESVNLLSFPNKWIRHATAHLVIVLSKLAHSIDLSRRIMPAIKVHFRRDIHGSLDEAALLDAIKTPLPRTDIGHQSALTGTQTNYQLQSAMTASGTSGGIVNSGGMLKSLSTTSLSGSAPVANQASAGKPNHVNRFKGALLAHLHEHKAAVNKLEVVPNSSTFISCSSDATIKFWDHSTISSRPQVLYRSRQTLIAPDAGAVSKIALCRGTDSLLALTEANNLHIFKLCSGSSGGGGQPRLTESISFSGGGDAGCDSELVVDLVSLSPFCYAVSSTGSNIRGYDLRMKKQSHVWGLKMDGKDGLITCMDGNQHCLAAGSSSSVLSLFDLRFYIRATSMSYPLYQDRVRKRIRSILLRKDEIYCSVDGNNEVSTWNCESGSRIKTLWASQAPCLSSTHSSHHSVMSMAIVDCCDVSGNFLADSSQPRQAATQQGGSNSSACSAIITAGTDMNLRFWDLNNPHRSYIINKPPSNRHHKLSPAKRQQAAEQRSDGSDSRRQATNNSASQTVYQTKLVDGIQVIQECFLKQSLDDQRKSIGSSRQKTAGNIASDLPSISEQSASSSLGANAAGSQSSVAWDPHEVSTAHHDSVSSLAIVPNFNLLLSASRDGVVKIWR